MNQDSGWRKRQIALDKKAENARELGLDYEPSIMEMAREAGFDSAPNGYVYHPDTGDEHPLDKYLEAFAALVREEAIAEANAKANASWTLMCEKMVAIEREACAELVYNSPPAGEYEGSLMAAYRAIRARSNT